MDCKGRVMKVKLGTTVFVDEDFGINSLGGGFYNFTVLSREAATALNKIDFPYPGSTGYTIEKIIEGIEVFREYGITIGLEAEMWLAKEK